MYIISLYCSGVHVLFPTLNFLIFIDYHYYYYNKRYYFYQFNVLISVQLKIEKISKEKGVLVDHKLFVHFIPFSKKKILLLIPGTI